jgi:hypothetical protein
MGKGPQPLPVMSGAPQVEAQLVKDSEALVPAAAPLVKEACAAVARAKTIAASIVDFDTFTNADNERVRFKDQSKAIEAAFADPKSKAYATHRSISKLEADLLKSPVEAAAIIERAQIAWRNAEQQKQLAAAAAIAAKAKKDAEEKALAQAEILTEEGRHEEAEGVLDDVKPEPTAPQPPAAPKVIGSNRKYWKWNWGADQLGADRLRKAVVAPIRAAVKLLLAEGAAGGAVTDLTEAAKLVEDFFCPDEKRIGGYVKTNEKAAVGKIPGVHVYEDERIA